MCRPQILQMNGFEYGYMNDKDFKEILEGILTDSETMYEYKRKTIEHKNPLLCKYFYIYSKGKTYSDQKKDEDEIWHHCDLNPNAIPKALPGSSRDPIVKIENEEFLKVKTQLLVIKSMKNVLSQLLDKGQDLLARLQQKSTKDSSLKEKAKELEKCTTKLSQFLKDARDTYAEIDLLDASCDCSGIVKRLKDMCDIGDAHVDGIKAMSKRFVHLL